MLTITLEGQDLEEHNKLTEQRLKDLIARASEAPKPVNAKEGQKCRYETF